MIANAGDAVHGGLAALALKLRHPLEQVRARALANLLFKMRARLVDVAHAPSTAVDALSRALVECLAVAALETAALHALQLLVLDAEDEAAARVCARALRGCGAAAVFQRGAVRNTSADNHATYEALLHRLLATDTGVADERVLTDSLSATTLVNSDPTPASTWTSRAFRAAHATVSAVANRRSAAAVPPGDPLTSGGWRFPRVALAAVDEQLLFEFEVKWRLRVAVPEIVEMCDTFRREMLRDFPPELFLQRPAILLRVLELARQPVVPAATSPELSFGVNYFDEPASRASFVWKPSVHATALHVSTLKALESWLSALRHAMEISLNPIYHTFPSSTSSNPLTKSTIEFDHRRLHYPRCLVPAEDDEGRDEETGLALGGAAYLVIATLMQLLTSPNYPHLHLLNVVHVATDFLAEQIISPQGRSGMNTLDKQRAEALFAILVDVVQVEGLSALAETRLLEWLLRVLRLFDSSAFRVENTTPARIDDISADLAIEVPSAVWTWMLRQLAISDWRDTKQFVETSQYLNEVDSSSSATLAQLSQSEEHSTQLQAALIDPSRGTSLPIALKIVGRVSSLSEDQRLVASQIVLRAIFAELERNGSDGDADLVNEVLARTISLAAQDSDSCNRLFGISTLDGLVEWILEEIQDAGPSGRLQAVLDSVSLSTEVVHILLVSLAAAIETTIATSSETLWRLAELLLRGYERMLEDSGAESRLRAFTSSIPILQHLAYVDSSLVILTESHQRLQRTLMHLVHRLEATLSVPDQLLLVSRCLLHRSAFIRKAASSGLLDRLDQLDHARVGNVPRSCVASIDPFGQFADSQGDNQRRVIEDEILALLQPRYLQNDATMSSTTGNSTLHRISRLRKLLSSLSMSNDSQPTTRSAAESALDQMSIDLIHCGGVDFQILEETGELEELMSLSTHLLSLESSGHTVWKRDLRGPVIGVIRVVLMRSEAWRQSVRRNARSLCVLLPLVFDLEPRVRAEMYFVVLALTCSVDVVSRLNAPSRLVVPTEFASTFGLFAARWSVCGVSTQPINAIVTKHTITAPVNSADLLSGSSTGERSRDASTQSVWTKLETANSFRTFLDALYHAIHASQAQAEVCKWLGARWKDASFRRYLETPPTSPKDQVVMAAVLQFANELFDCLSKADQMDVVLLLRRNVIPLQLAHGHHPLKTQALSRELVRLLLRISASEVADMFVPLLVDTGLIKKLGELVVAGNIAGESAPLQRSMWIEVAWTALTKAQTLGGGSAVQGQIKEAVFLPLETIAGRHHVPGSFQERDSLVRSVACLTRLHSPGDEARWHTRLVFDCSSTLRAIGFHASTWAIDNGDPDTTNRVLRLAVDTMREETECDAVRSSAGELLFQFFDNVSTDALRAHSPFVDGDKFLPQLIRELELSARARDECVVRLNLSRVRLLRLFALHHEKFAETPFSDPLGRLLSDDQDEFRSLRPIIELLSLRHTSESYDRHNAQFLHRHPQDDSIWQRSMLPVILSTISESAQLLQSLLFQFSTRVSAIVIATPLLQQLVETIVDTSKHLQHHQVDGIPSVGQRYYEALDQCGKLFTVLLASNASTSLPSDIPRLLVRAMAHLLGAHQPKRFRQSFSRIIPAILCRKSDVLSDQVIEPSNAVPFGISLWMSYQELCAQQPLDRVASPNRRQAHFPPLRRIGFALVLLVSKSQEATSALCGGRYDAVQYLVRLMKTGFASIRMAGGFGAKSAAKRGSDEPFVVELCQFIELQCQVLGGLMVLSATAQNDARSERLPDIIAENWNTMRIAHRRGSTVLLSALRLLQNFIHANDANKTCLAATMASSSTARNVGGDGERNLLAFVGEIALGGSANASFDSVWISMAGSILKSAFLQIECLHTAIKTGLVTKLFASVIERTKNERQTTKALSLHEERTLIELIGVLASVASIDEGRQVALQVHDLRNFLDDIFHFADDSQLLVAGALFVRNMAFSTFSKSHFSVWEPALHQILSHLYRWGIDSTESVEIIRLRILVTADHLSTALLCFVHDNQRAQSVLQSPPKALVLLREASRSWARKARVSTGGGAQRSATVSANLERVQRLIGADSDSQP